MSRFINPLQSSMFLRQALATSRAARRTLYRPARFPTASHSIAPSSIAQAFSTNQSRRVSLMPESEDPPAPTPDEASHPAGGEPSPLTDQEYHEHADRYLNEIIHEVEQIQEDRQDVDVEHAAGVLTLTFPPNGTYVINKQPPNKQIWLSSPITGPKRFNWVIRGEGMSEKEGAGIGDWVYLRDGTSMTQLLGAELGITIGQGDAGGPE